MNAVDRFFLKLFLLPRAFYLKQGVDVNQLTAILTAKLTMDNRRPISFMANRRKNTNSKKKPTDSTLNTMLAILIMGFFLLFILLIGHDLLSKVTMYTTAFIFMLCVTLITDFTSVLIDPRDNLIILPKPISDKTFLMSRLLHIAIRLCLIVLPLSLPGAIALVSTDGILMLLPFLFIVVLMALFSVFIINAVYLIILKVTTPQKFNTIISGIQIAFIVIVMGGYQLLPRLMYSDTFKSLDLTTIPWMHIYPPYWFSEACLFMSGKLVTPAASLGLLLSIFVPLISLWMVIRFFAPSFIRKLSQISGGTAEKKERSSKVVGKGLMLKERFGRLLTKPGTEYAGFVFSWDMMARSKDFKLRVYPAFGYLIVMSVVFYLQHHPIKTLALVMTYFSSTIVYQALYQISYSDMFKAAWMFHTTPIATPGKLLSGTLKSILVQFYLPVALLILVINLVLFGYSNIPSILLAITNVLLISLIQAYLNLQKLPFSEKPDPTGGGKTFAKAFIILLPIMCLGFLHYFIADMLWVVILLLVISATVSWLLMDEIKKKKWSSIKS